jgi:ABC-2 type transport system permease protein
MKILSKLRIYWLFWLKRSSMSFQSLIAARLASALFVLGKLIRFFFFLWFLLILKTRLTLVAGYNFDQLVIFFLVFNFFDLLSQFFFRGIYWFRQDIVSGTFDFKLIKPISPLFNILTNHTDFLDLPLLIVVIIMLVSRISSVSFLTLINFSLLGLGAILTITAIHIVVAAIGVITTEVDHTIWIFRDLGAMGRMPIDIYADFIRAFLTFIVPIALIFTVPAKALFGLLSYQTIIISLLASVIIYLLSLKFWRYALTQYSSASS